MSIERHEIPEMMRDILNAFEDGKKERPPTLDELRRSSIFFVELTDALQHYQADLPPNVTLVTLTTRLQEDGEPGLEIVSETRMPPLDDMSDHFYSLGYAAEKLDTVPPSWWHDYYSTSSKVPHVAMQIVSWGGLNEIMNSGRNFMLQAGIRKEALERFSWTETHDSDSDRDMAEQCFRITDAYVQLKEYFDEVGLPPGMETF